MSTELESEVQQWRAMFEKMQAMPVNKDQGSNTAPAFSIYMYESRRAFVAPRKTNKPIEQVDELALNAYSEQLSLEKNEWEQNARSFAPLLKKPGSVVYHPSSVYGPGYCTPSLVVDGPTAFTYLVGAAVGDRVKTNVVATPLEPKPMRYPSDSSDSSYEEICSKLSRNVKRERRAEHGVITSISVDRHTEVSTVITNERSYN
jgi:hypothetical protein